MLTIPEIDLIAKLATERIAKEFAESGFANPPVVTHGIARAVLEAAEQSFAPDTACAECQESYPYHKVTCKSAGF